MFLWSKLPPLTTVSVKEPGSTWRVVRIDVGGQGNNDLSMGKCKMGPTWPSVEAPFVEATFYGSDGRATDEVDYCQYANESTKRHLQSHTFPCFRCLEKFYLHYCLILLTRVNND